jgi:glycosyltransferase involved in cell wall biosynthesis
MSFLGRALRKLKKEGLPGVWRVAKRMIMPFFSGFSLKKINKDKFNVLYVIGFGMGECKRYRVYNLIEALALYGIFAQAVYLESLPYTRLKGYDVVVFFRCKMNSKARAGLKRCRKYNISTVYDIDDLLFDETYFDKIRDDENMSDGIYKSYINEAQRYRECLKACDYSTSPTNYMCDYMQNLSGSKSFCIPNGINQKQIETAVNLSFEPSADIKIGFLSGSTTHNKDFIQVAEALVYILKKYSHVSLVIAGWLDLPECLKPFENRISRLPYMDYISLMKYTVELYTVVVPLEYEIPFCNAKSELKYFEQALVGVPVIASPTAPYKNCITDGVNGMLAKNSEQWKTALERVANDKEYRDALAENARVQIREEYYPEKIGEIVNYVYNQIKKET